MITHSKKLVVNGSKVTTLEHFAPVHKRSRAGSNGKLIMCPHCGSKDVKLVPASGKGEIYSWSVLRRAKPPFAIAYVTLEEGPTMMTNIIDCDLDSLTIGQKVELKFSATEDPNGPPVPTFKPI